MPIVLKNRSKLPPADVETVTVLGLEIPLTDSLPFGAQVELYDLQAAKDAGEMGQFEFMLRLLCIYTRRLPRSEWLKYSWLEQQTLDAEEMAELVTGLNALINYQAAAREVAVGEGKAAKKKKAAN